MFLFDTNLITIGNSAPGLQWYGMSGSFFYEVDMFTHPLEISQVRSTKLYLTL